MRRIGDMDGRQTVVTGAATLIGRGVVQAFVDRGAMVIAVDESEDAVVAAVEAAWPADAAADAVITRGLDDSGLGSWWDLANLVAAYYHSLDVLVHIPRGDAVESLPLAIGRLQQSLKNAERARPDSVGVFVIARDAREAVARARRDRAAGDSDIRLLAFEPGAARETVPAVVERVVACVTGQSADGTRTKGARNA